MMVNTCNKEQSHRYDNNHFSIQVKIEEKMSKPPLLPLSSLATTSNGGVDLANIIPPGVNEVKLGSPLGKDSPYSLTLSQRTSQHQHQQQQQPQQHQELDQQQPWNSSMKVII